MRLPWKSEADNDLLAGGYVADNITCKLAADSHLFGGVQSQKAGQYSLTVQGETAVLNLDQSIFVVVGVTYAF